MWRQRPETHTGRAGTSCDQVRPPLVKKPLSPKKDPKFHRELITNRARGSRIRPQDHASTGKRETIQGKESNGQEARGVAHAPGEQRTQKGPGTGSTQGRPRGPAKPGPEPARSSERPRTRAKARQPTRRPNRQARRTANRSKTSRQRESDPQSRSQRKPVSQLQALTDRQKERPERRSLGESIPAVPTAFWRGLAADVGTAGIHRLSRYTTAGARIRIRRARFKTCQQV